MTAVGAGPHPKVYTLSEAAQMLRVRESWLERQAAARRIPFTMLGGSYRFTGEHLIQIVRMHEITPAPEDPQPALEQHSRPRKTRAKPTLEREVVPLRARSRRGPRGG